MNISFESLEVPINSCRSVPKRRILQPRIGSLAVLLMTLCFGPDAATAQNVAPVNSSSSQATTMVPRLLKFTGTLKDQRGTPLTGVTGVTFSLYKDQEAGAALWMETQNVHPDSNGRYTVMLGSSKADGIPTELFTSGDARWLGTQVQGQNEQSRVLLLSVPYALKAADAETVGGKPASAFVLAPTTSNLGSPATTGARTQSASGQNTRSQSSPTMSATVSGSGSTNSIPLWTSSTALGNSALVQSGANVGIGGSSTVARFTASTSLSGGIGVMGQASLTSSNSVGVQGISASSSGVGIFGKATTTAGGVFGPSSYGVEGTTAGGSGSGVFGSTTSVSPFTSGVTGSAPLFAVVGNSTTTTSPTGSNPTGVLGTSASPGGMGVRGTNSGGGTGVYGNTSGTSGLANGAASVLGDSHNYYGVWGTSASNDGVHGDTASATHYGAAGVNHGGGAGLYGLAASTTGQGVYGESFGSTAANGIGSDGVHGVAHSGAGSGVAGINQGGGVGVYGSATSTSGQGVFGESFGTSFSNNSGPDGVHGLAHTNAGSGVAGINNAAGGTGVFASAPSGFGVVTDSNVKQNRSMGGWLKAMVYVDPYSPTGTAITRCYNSQASGAAVNTPPCGFTVTHEAQGTDTLDFGFQVSDRFLQVTGEVNNGCLSSFNCGSYPVGSLDSENQPASKTTVFIVDAAASGGHLVDNPFYVLVF